MESGPRELSCHLGDVLLLARATPPPGSPLGDGVLLPCRCRRPACPWTCSWSRGPRTCAGWGLGTGSGDRGARPCDCQFRTRALLPLTPASLGFFSSFLFDCSNTRELDLCDAFTCTVQGTKDTQAVLPPGETLSPLLSVTAAPPGTGWDLSSCARVSAGTKRSGLGGLRRGPGPPPCLAGRSSSGSCSRPCLGGPVARTAHGSPSQSPSPPTPARGRGLTSWIRSELPSWAQCSHCHTVGDICPSLGCSGGGWGLQV